MADKKEENLWKLYEEQHPDIVKKTGGDRGLMSASFNEWSSGIKGTENLESMGKATDKRGNEIKKETLEKNAINQANAKSAAQAAYDTGTTQKDNGSGNQMANTQKAANAIEARGKQLKHDSSKKTEDVLSKVKSGKATKEDFAELAYRVENGDIDENSIDPATKKALDNYKKQNTIPTHEQGAEIGKKVAQSQKKMSDEDIEKTTNEITEIENDPDVEATVQAATGKSFKDEAPSDQEAKEGITNIVNDIGVVTTVPNGDDGYEFKLDPRLENNWTDKVAIGLTALSAILCAVSGGSILPVNFKKIMGTDQKMEAATKVIADANRVFNENKETRHGNTAGAIASGADIDKTKKAMKDQITPEQRQKAVEQFKKAYPNATDEEINAMVDKQIDSEIDKHLKETTGLAGELGYNQNDTSAAQKVANDFRLEEISAMTESDLAKIAAQSDASIKQLMAQGQNEIALAKVVQDLKNKSGTEVARYTKQLKDELGDSAYSDLYNAIAQGVRAEHGIDSVWNGINIANAAVPSHVQIMGQTIDKDTSKFSL